MWSATVVVRSRTSARPPGSRTARSSASVALETEMNTVPTGFSSEPPPGPAMPVIPTPSGAAPRRAPAAVPWRSPRYRAVRRDQAALTPEASSFASFEYTTSPPNTGTSRPRP